RARAAVWVGMVCPSCPLGSPRYPSSAAQTAHDALHPGPSHSRIEIGHGGAFSNVAPDWVWKYRHGEGPDIEVLADRERPGGDQLAGLGPDDGSAEDAAAGGGHDLDVAGRLALDIRAVVLVQRPAPQPAAAAAARRRGPRPGNPGEPGGGGGHAREHGRIQARKL